MIYLTVKKLNSLSDKTKGLIFYKKSIPVFFKTRFGIHTFGMKFPIDVLILDKNFLVVKEKKDLKPNRIFLWNPKFNNVIEMPGGEIKKYKIKIGSEIKIN